MVVMPLDALVDPSIQRLTAVSYKRYPLSSKISLLKPMLKQQYRF